MTNEGPKWTRADLADAVAHYDEIEAACRAEDLPTLEPGHPIWVLREFARAALALQPPSEGGLDDGMEAAWALYASAYKGRERNLALAPGRQIGYSAGFEAGARWAHRRDMAALGLGDEP